MKKMALSSSVTRLIALVCSFTVASSAFLIQVPAYAVIANPNSTPTPPGPATHTIDSGSTAVVHGNSSQSQTLTAGGASSPVPHTSNVSNTGTLIIDFSNLVNGTLKLDALTNNAGGTIYGIAQASSGLTQGIINANTITNYGMITTVLPQAGLQGYNLANLVPNLSLVFNIGGVNGGGPGALYNNGVIASANNLIFNATSASTQIVNQANAVMAATNNITFNASQVTNLGAILAGVNSSTQAILASVTASQALNSIKNNIGNLTGILTFNNALNNTLSITNTGGILAASNINFNGLPSLAPIFGDGPQLFAGVNNTAANVNITGGQLIAQTVNINAGTDSFSAGNVNLQANSITGSVNAYGSSATIGVAKGDLSLASLTLVSDPLIYDKAGSLVVDFGKLSGQNGAWTFLAGQNISATQSSVGQTFNSGSNSITMNAGQSFYIGEGGGGYELNGASKKGGNINLTGVNLTTNGANISLTAHAGNTGSGAISVGDLTTTNNGFSFDFFNPFATLNGGNVTVSGGRGGVTTGAITTNGADSFFAAAGNAGSISLKAKGDIVTGALTANGGNGTGFIFGSADGGNGGNITVNSTKNSVSILGNVLSKGGNGADGVASLNLGNGDVIFPDFCIFCGGQNGGNGGKGGNIKITANGDISTQKVQSIGGNGGNGANGGNPVDQIFLEFSSTDATNGGNGGNSGTLKITSKNGNITLNDCVGTLGGNGGNGGNGTSGFGGGSAGTAGFGGNAKDVTISADNALVAGKIESFGGNAGNGGNGGDGFFGADGGGVRNRKESGSGGSSGNISITAGSVTINDTVETLGGNGGNGGNGGAGFIGGNGGNGGQAGNAGNISIAAEENLTVTRVLSFGGNGGNGGNGGVGAVGGGSGGNAGGQSQNRSRICCEEGSGNFSGGNSGSIRLKSYDGNVIITDAVQTAGGTGGNGGNGGSADYAGDGGNAGKGGNAGNICVTANDISAATIMSFGGNSGNGGNGGTGVWSGGSGGNAGSSDRYSESSFDAGKSGNITLTANNTLTVTGPIQTAGGNGGNGGNGGSASSTEYGEDGVNGGSGGSGGRGGKAGNITLTASGSAFFLEDVGFLGNITTGGISSFGGNGGNGGSGGNGLTATGSGGNGGNGGDSGAITLQTGLFGQINAKGDIQTAGGRGGNGGLAGLSTNLDLNSEIDYRNGGEGGRGGNAKSITISTAPASIGQLTNFGSDLFNGDSNQLGLYLLIGLFYIGTQNGGQFNIDNPGGIANVFTNALAYPTVQTQRVMSFGGAGGSGAGTEEGGRGGNSGPITVGNLIGGTYLNGALQTAGGRGGDGGSGLNANGNWGGSAGDGGKAGNILVASLFGNINSNRLLSFGGDGGAGGVGSPSSWDGGGQGGRGGNGGKSGSITVQTFIGNINLRDTVQTSGGNGGAGGIGGDGVYLDGWNGGGRGGNGGKGGNAGNIQIGAGIGNLITQDVLSFGGNGGAGGAGGGNSAYGGNGGNGGKGATSGSINLSTAFAGQEVPFFGNSFRSEFSDYLGIDFSIKANGTVQTKGGDGGVGGAGGAALVDNGYAGGGGNGGNGGKAKNITVEAWGGITANDVLSFGGNGGAGGAGGFGQQYGGYGGNGHKAGNSGNINITSAFDSVTIKGTVQTAGGDGGNGGLGGSTAGVNDQAYGGSGGDGGRGGNAGSIKITAQQDLTTNAVMSFGGNGGAGGNGGNLFWSGSGGAGGDGGNGGHISLRSKEGTLTLNGPVFLAYGVGGQGGNSGTSDSNAEGASTDQGWNGEDGWVGCIRVNAPTVINYENINWEPQACCAGRVSAKSPVSPELPVLAVNPVPGETGFCCNPTKPVIITNLPPTPGTPEPPNTENPGPNTPPTFTIPQGLFGLLPNSDTTRNRSANLPDTKGGTDVDYLDEISDNNSPNWVVITNKGQPYALQGDDGTLIIGTPGTIFGQTGDHTITLKQGSILVLAGAGIDIQTQLGLISVKPGGAAGVTEGRFGTLDIANLGSDKVTLSANYKGNTSQVFVGSNQQLDVTTSEIATAGASDFVPSADAMAAIVAGLSGNTSNLKDGKQFLAMLQSVSGRNLTPEMKTALGGLIQALMGIGSNPSGKSPLSYRPSDDGKYYVPVAFAVPTTSALNMDEMSMVTLTGVQARCLVSTQMTTDQGGKVNLKDGDVLVDSNKLTEILAGNCRITVGKKTIALVSRKGGIVKVRNIVENNADSVTVTVGDNRAIILHAGQEAVIGPTKDALNSELKADSVARRHVRAVDSDKEHLSIAEFSIISLCSNSKLMNQMIRSEQVEDKRVYEKMLKMAACLTQVTSSHGAYEQAK